MEKNLHLEDLNKEDKILIEPDSVFWGIVKNNGNSPLPIPAKLLSLYEKMKKKSALEMHRFRFTSKLSAVYIDPTDRCNANCPYCYVPAKTRKYGHSMSEKELNFILTKIKKYFSHTKQKPVIIFHASEPLIVKDILFKLILKFKKDFYFGIQTNGLLLEEKDVEFIKKHKISIGISLDAADAKTNNRLRPNAKYGGHFQKVNQVLEWFRGYKGLNILTTITKLNVSKLPELVKFLYKKEVPCVLMNPIRLTQKNSRTLKPDTKIMTKYFLKAVKQSLKYSMNSKKKIVIGNFANTLLGIIAPTARRLMCDISPCGGGRCFFTITADGKMIPCGEFIGLSKFSGGNIFKDSIEKAMCSKPFKQIRSRIVEKIPECDVCIFRNICGAPCPAELHSLGNMSTKAVFCDFYKEVIKYAFKIIAEKKEKHCFRKDGFNSVEVEYKL